MFILNNAQEEIDGFAFSIAHLNGESMFDIPDNVDSFDNIVIDLSSRSITEPVQLEITPLISESNILKKCSTQRQTIIVPSWHECSP